MIIVLLLQFAGNAADHPRSFQQILSSEEGPEECIDSCRVISGTNLLWEDYIENLMQKYPDNMHIPFVCGVSLESVRHALNIIISL